MKTAKDLTVRKQHKERDRNPQASAINKSLMFARGRLLDLPKVFLHRGWHVAGMPKNDRAYRILRCLADHVWIAKQHHEEIEIRFDIIRHLCVKFAPWMTPAELQQIVDDTPKSNKRWTNDQVARVLELTALEAAEIGGLRFLGACDDDDRIIRDAIKRAKTAERNRRYRASRRTGAQRGRPSSNLSDEERVKLKKAQNAERNRRYRAAHSSGRKPGRPPIETQAAGRTYAEKPRDAKMRDATKNKNSSVTQLSVTELSHAPSIIRVQFDGGIDISLPALINSISVGEGVLRPKR
jgi:hypothetical protein